MRLPVFLLALAGHVSAQRRCGLNRDSDDTRERVDKKDRAAPIRLWGSPGPDAAGGPANVTAHARKLPCR